MVLNVTDADLLLQYLNNTSPRWTDAQIIAATGYPNVPDADDDRPGQRRADEVAGRRLQRGHPRRAALRSGDEPDGRAVRHLRPHRQQPGRDRKTGFARRPIDNVGVQYGLAALNAGAISVDMFLDLNQRIGGYDVDGNYVSARTVADEDALKAAYESGRVTNGGLGLRTTPIIDYRGYVDQPENAQEVHSRFHSFSLRERLLGTQRDLRQPGDAGRGRPRRGRPGSSATPARC